MAIFRHSEYLSGARRRDIEDNLREYTAESGNIWSMDRSGGRNVMHVWDIFDSTSPLMGSG